MAPTRQPFYEAQSSLKQLVYNLGRLVIPCRDCRRSAVNKGQPLESSGKQIFMDVGVNREAQRDTVSQMLSLERFPEVFFCRLPNYRTKSPAYLTSETKKVTISTGAIFSEGPKFTTN